MGTLLQWSLLAQALLRPSCAALIARVSLHVSLCKFHGGNYKNRTVKKK